MTSRGNRKPANTHQERRDVTVPVSRPLRSANATLPLGRPGTRIQLAILPVRLPVKLPGVIPPDSATVNISAVWKCLTRRTLLVSLRTQVRLSARADTAFSWAEPERMVICEWVALRQ